MPTISVALPVLPGFPQTHAPWPVWRGSIAGPVRFMPMARKEAARLWQGARLGSRDAPARTARRRYRPRRARRLLLSDARFSELPDRPYAVLPTSQWRGY